MEEYMKLNINKDKTTSHGVNFLELLFLLFLGLKLANLINWSWIWVFAPIWIPALGVLLFFGVAFVYLIVANAVDKGRIDGKTK